MRDFGLSILNINGHDKNLSCNHILNMIPSFRLLKITRQIFFKNTKKILACFWKIVYNNECCDIDSCEA